MILPPHILKYQKKLQELQELNKLSTVGNSSSSKKIENEQNKKFHQKEKNKGKNKYSNKFLQLNSTTKDNNINNKNSHNNLTSNFNHEENQEDLLEKEVLVDNKNKININESESETEEEKEIKEEEQNKEEKHKLSKREEKMKNNWRIYRKGAGVIWQDESLNEWPENDYRIFVGDLGNEVNDQVLANAFIKYPSFAKAKVIRNKITGKTKGYGFVSVMDLNDYIKIMREMKGKYVGNRPIRLKRSTWKDRSVMYSTSKMPDAVFLKKKRNKGEIINTPEITDMKLLKKDPTLGGLLNQIK